MSKNTYEVLAEQRDRLDAWVRFIGDIAGNEWFDYIEALNRAASAAISMSEDSAAPLFAILEAEIKEARKDWIPAAVEDYSEMDPAVHAVYQRLCETGERKWPAKPTNAEVMQQLARCGDGESSDGAWHPDELIKLAKMLRANRA